MNQSILIDTSVLIALLSRSDRYHEWALSTVSQLQKPFLTCEAVITETCFLLRRNTQSHQQVFAFLEREALVIPFVLNQELHAISALMEQYKSVPMSLADACLVRMAECFPGSRVLTLDDDFQIYRMNRNQVIPVISSE